MLKHDSLVMERFALKAHCFWAFASLGQAMFSIAAAWILAPVAMWTIGLFGSYLFGILMLLYAQIVLGIGGFVFHIFGARDHSANIAKLN